MPTWWRGFTGFVSCVPIPSEPGGTRASGIPTGGFGAVKSSRGHAAPGELFLDENALCQVPSLDGSLSRSRLQLQTITS